MLLEMVTLAFKGWSVFLLQNTGLMAKQRRLNKIIVVDPNDVDAETFDNANNVEMDCNFDQGQTNSTVRNKLTQVSHLSISVQQFGSDHETPTNEELSLDNGIEHGPSSTQ